jgi:hypothetical protein
VTLRVVNTSEQKKIGKKNQEEKARERPVSSIFQRMHSVNGKIEKANMVWGQEFLFGC